MKEIVSKAGRIWQLGCSAAAISLIASILNIVPGVAIFTMNVDVSNVSSFKFVCLAAVFFAWSVGMALPYHEEDSVEAKPQ